MGRCASNAQNQILDWTNAERSVNTPTLNGVRAGQTGKRRKLNEKRSFEQVGNHIDRRQIMNQQRLQLIRFWGLAFLFSLGISASARAQDAVFF